MTTHCQVLNPSPVRSEVAVIVPCHNVEQYLGRALDSVLVQTYRNFHIYAVDDGSTDGTAAVLKDYAQRCSAVRQNHAGPAAARNRAIRMSDSPFVAFLDADDEWLPAKLERQIALLKQDSSLGLVCSLCVVKEPNREKYPAFAAGTISDSGKLFQYLVRDCFAFTPTVVVRRRCLEEVGLFNESLAVSEDFNLWLRIAARWNIALLPEVLVTTHKRPGSLSVRIPAEQRLRNGVAALQHVWSTCADLSSAERDALRNTLAERIYCHGSCLLSAGDRQRGRQQLLAALKLQPAHWRALARVGLSFLPTVVSTSLVGLKRILAGLRRGAAPQFAPKDGSQFDVSAQSKQTADAQNV
jgi:hypothetical protein